MQPNSILADYSGQLRVVCEATLPNLPSSVDKIRMKMLKSYVGMKDPKLSAGGVAEDGYKGIAQVKRNYLSI